MKEQSAICAMGFFYNNMISYMFKNRKKQLEENTTKYK